MQQVVQLVLALLPICALPAKLIPLITTFNTVLTFALAPALKANTQFLQRFSVFYAPAAASLALGIRLLVKLADFLLFLELTCFFIATDAFLIVQQDFTGKSLIMFVLPVLLVVRTAQTHQRLAVRAVPTSQEQSIINKLERTHVQLHALMASTSLCQFHTTARSAAPPASLAPTPPKTAPTQTAASITIISTITASALAPLDFTLTLPSGNVWLAPQDAKAVSHQVHLHATLVLH